jgi:hypothetical protein
VGAVAPEFSAGTGSPTPGSDCILPSKERTCTARRCARISRLRRVPGKPGGFSLSVKAKPMET